MTGVSTRHLRKVFPGTAGAALDGLSLDITSGECIALLGPSGCGKTTALKIIAGLLHPTSGDVQFDGRSVLSLKPEARQAVMVFQNHLLFPHLSIADNVGFGLRMRGIEKTTAKMRISQALTMVQLPGFEDRKPSELSGGQQQRVALARALVLKPHVLLLDEPLSNLDEHLRNEMRELIRALQRELAITTIFVTHDQEEAVSLGQRVAVLLDGKLNQYAAPRELYEHPVNERVARFFGGKNFFPGSATAGVFKCALGEFKLIGVESGSGGILTFRPEAILVGAAAENAFEARLVSKTYLGIRTRLRFTRGDAAIEADLAPGRAESLSIGELHHINIPAKSLWVIPA
jgi:ABC-type Fe3+/spermidine/putrescine transport system ATPase subunit